MPMTPTSARYEICPVSSFGRRWWWNCIGCAVRTAGSRRRKCRSYRARRRSASASKRRRVWPVRARRCDVWRDSLECPAARSEPWIWLSEALGGGAKEAGFAADGGRRDLSGEEAKVPHGGEQSGNG